MDPTLPDMSFVRTRRPDVGEIVYIPGSSFRGVLRSHAERLVRSVNPRDACDPTGARGSLGQECGRRMNKADQSGGAEVYMQSCYACRIFGNTAISGRVRVEDLYPIGEVKVLTETRYGVAIDRVTGAVAQGPFELETVTDGEFRGRIAARNLTVGNLGLLSAALLDISDGLVPLGYGKSRGLGRVQLRFSVAFRTLKDPKGLFLGAGALCTDEERSRYQLPQSSQDVLELPGISQDQEHRPSGRRGFYELRAEDDLAVQWLEAAAPRWLAEVAS